MNRSRRELVASASALVIACVGAPTWVGVQARAAEPAPVDPAPVGRFKALSAQAEAAFQARQYQSAVDAYLEAYGVLPNSEVLYNVAYIYDYHLNRRSLAEDFYRRVIREPQSSKELIALSIKRLEELEALDRTVAPAIEPTPPVMPQPSPGDTGGVNDRLVRDTGPGAGPWVLVGIGGAAVIGGVAFGLAAQSTNEDFKAIDDLAQKRTFESDGKAQALTSDLLWVGGGLLVVSGLIWYFAASGDEADPKVGTSLVQPFVMRDGAGVMVGGTL